MSNPLISILVPIFNVEQYLEKCLDNLVNQTMKNIEIICIDDGSTDNSLYIAKKYAEEDPRIVLIQKKNTGYGNTMNIGLQKAKGEYIGIVESDDFAELEMFDKLYEAAKKSNADIVKSNYIDYKSFKNIQKSMVEMLRECRYNYLFSPCEDESVFFTPPNIWAGIYNREFLINNKIIFNETSGASYQDTSFAFKVWSYAKRAYLVRDAYLNYRTDNMDSSVASSNKIFCVCDELKEIEKFIENNDLQHKEKLKRIKFAIKFRTYRWNYNRLISAYQYAFLIKMSEELKIDFENGLFDEKYWQDNDIEELELIINNPDEYFKNTAKAYKDNRLISLPTLNTTFYFDGFIDNIKKYENIIIYGAGIIGKKVAETLSNNNIEIRAFAVTDKSNNEKEVLGIDVFNIKDLRKYSDNAVVVVSVKEKDQYDIINNLTKLKFKNIISFDSILLNKINNEKIKE